MILSHPQLVAIVRFAGNEEVFVSHAFTLNRENEAQTINVGRERDGSIIRVAADGTTFALHSGSRTHEGGHCWCGERHV